MIHLFAKIDKIPETRAQVIDKKSWNKYYTLIKTYNII